MPSITFCFNSCFECVEQVAASVRGLCEQASFSQAQMHEIELSVVEALNNTVEHAYADRDDGRISMTWALTERDLRIDILNWGRSMAGVPQVDLPGASAERGRGWPIMHSCVDEVEYFSEQGVNTLRLVKILKP